MACTVLAAGDRERGHVDLAVGHSWGVREAQGRGEARFSVRETCVGYAMDRSGERSVFVVLSRFLLLVGG